MISGGQNICGEQYLYGDIIIFTGRFFGDFTIF